METYISYFIEGWNTIFSFLNIFLLIFEMYKIAMYAMILFVFASVGTIIFYKLK